MNKDEYREFYDEIVKFYDLAEVVIDVIENSNEDTDVQVALAAPVIEQVRESADILTEAYLRFIENGEKLSNHDIKRIENAMRKIFASILNFKKEMKKHY